MTVNFTKKEYRVLVEMLLIADWIIHADAVDPVEKTASYADLRKKVLLHYKEMGLEDGSLMSLPTSPRTELRVPSPPA